MKKKIIVIDDDPEILEILKLMLGLENYDVTTVENGLTGLSYIRENRYDLALLDLNLPDIDGQHLCKIIRNEVDLPVLIVSARDDVSVKVICLEYGADDYITKPFENIELIARVKAVLRRTDKGIEQQTGSDDSITFHHLVLDLKSRQVYSGEEKLDITPKEYELLVYFANNRGRVLDRDEIIGEIWDKSALYKWSRSLDVHVKNLRQKIEVNSKNPDLIQTVTGVGYKIKK